MFPLQRISKLVLWLLAAVCIASGCSHKPKLTQSEVIQTANAAATNEGFILSEYDTPKPQFEFPGGDHIWLVMYNMKLPAPWNPILPTPHSAHGAPQHFVVFVDDKTTRTRIDMIQEVVK